MTCAYCGTHLLAGAMFCGECGRPVSSVPGRSNPARVASAAPSSPQRPSSADLIEPDADSHAPVTEPVTEPVADEPEPGHAPALDAPAQDAPSPTLAEPAAAAPPVTSIPEPAAPPPPRVPDFESLSTSEIIIDLLETPEPDRCAQCGTEFAPGDIFCGECGFVRNTTAVLPQTASFDPFPWGLPRSVEPASSAEPVAPGAPDLPAAPEEPAEPAALDLPPEPAASVAPVAPAAPAEHPSGASTEAQLQADLDETRIVDRTRGGERFVLQFSTGESVTVTGTGLVGRNPIAEPGEYVDHFVVIVDPGKSVSKTHLEFGQDAGAFWISDRFSGNGTIVREPEREPRRAEAGKRYRVSRGSRVDIGEQFFVVS